MELHHQAEDGETNGQVVALISFQALTFIDTAPGAWTFPDVIYTLQDRDRLCEVLKQTEAGRERLKSCFANEETARNIVSTLNTRINRYLAVAGAWQRAIEQGRMLSLNDFMKQEYVLVLGNSHKARPAVQAINQVLFTRLKDLILDQGESETRRTWIFLDEVRQAGRLEALTALLVEGRSRGACVVLGFQDIEGMKAVHTPYLANELMGQAHNICFTKLVNPETAAHGSHKFGEVEETVENVSITESSRGGRSRTVSSVRVKKQAVMASQFMSSPMPSRKKGLSFYAITSGPLGSYHHTMSGEEVASMLCASNTDPAKGGMPNRMPIPGDWERLRPWSLADYLRLKLQPPVQTLQQTVQLVPTPGGLPAGGRRQRVVRKTP